MPGFGGLDLAGQPVVVFEGFHHGGVAALGVAHLAPAVCKLPGGQFPGVLTLLDGLLQVGGQPVNGLPVVEVPAVHQLEQLAGVGDGHVTEPVQVDVRPESVRLDVDQGVWVGEHGAALTAVPIWQGGNVAPGLRHLVLHGPGAARGHGENRVMVFAVQRDKRAEAGPGVGTGVVFKHLFLAPILCLNGKVQM